MGPPPRHHNLVLVWTASRVSTVPDSVGPVEGVGDYTNKGVVSWTTAEGGREGTWHTHWPQQALGAGTVTDWTEAGHPCSQPHATGTARWSGCFWVQALLWQVCNPIPSLLRVCD